MEHAKFKKLNKLNMTFAIVGISVIVLLGLLFILYCHPNNVKYLESLEDSSEQFGAGIGLALHTVIGGIILAVGVALNVILQSVLASLMTKKEWNVKKTKSRAICSAIFGIFCLLHAGFCVVFLNEFVVYPITFPICFILAGIGIFQLVYGILISTKRKKIEFKPKEEELIEVSTEN